MEIHELAQREPGLGEEVVWRETGGWLGNVVVEPNCMLHGHGPQLGVRHIGPVESGMDLDGSSNCHDCADASLS